MAVRDPSVRPAAGRADFTFVHLTDTHIMAGAPPWDGRVDTAACLRQVIAVINALEPRPAFAVVGGDLASPDLADRTRTPSTEEYEPSYALLREILAELRCPTHLLLGNHDHRRAFQRVLGAGGEAAHRWSFDHQGYHFVGLDSHVPGEAWGEVDPGQLEWLAGDLAAHRGRPALVFVHHHPWPLGLTWMDAMGLRNGDELGALLERFPDVRWIVCGHVHLDHAAERRGLTMLTTPATCFQVSKLSQTRKILPGPPAFRLVRVSGLELATRVLHLRDGGIESL
jgi:3',5'-cyclic-AMP phosphodiesterase